MLWIPLGLAGLLLAALLTLLTLRVRFRGRVASLWQAADQGQIPDPRVFTTELVERLPQPIQRYFLHALEPGTDLVSRVQLTGEGVRQGELAPWPYRFQALVVPPRGFVWRADFRSPLVQVLHYLDDRAGLRSLRLWLLPRTRAGDPNRTRSARHRLAAEHLWLPASLLPQNGVSWERLDDHRARAKLLLDAEPVDLVLTIADDGRLEQAALRRWTDRTGDESWGFRYWIARATGEMNFQGRTIPAQLSLGFASDETGADFEEIDRVTVTEAHYR